jgi:UDP-N-acetylmuramate-alanine ligase
LTEIYTASAPNKLPKLLAAILRERDVVLTIGAGTITEAAPAILHTMTELQTLELAPEHDN